MSKDPQTPQLRTRPVESLLREADRALHEAQGKVKEAIFSELKDRLGRDQGQYQMQAEMIKSTRLTSEINELRQQNQSLHHQNEEQSKHLHRMQAEALKSTEEVSQVQQSNYHLVQDIIRISSEKAALSQERDQGKEQLDIEILERQITELALDQYKDEVAQYKLELDEHRAYLQRKTGEVRRLEQITEDQQEQIILYEGMLIDRETLIADLQHQLEVEHLIHTESLRAIDETTTSSPKGNIGEKETSGNVRLKEESHLHIHKRTRSSTPGECMPASKRLKSGQ